MVVELLHRTSSAVLTVLVVGLVGWAVRLFEHQHPARKAAVASAIFLVVEALVGAALVKLDLVVHNASTARGVWMAVHLVNTFALLGSLALTVYFARPVAVPLRRLSPPILAVLVGAFASTLLVGATGAVAALGDTLFPAASLAAGMASELDSAAHIFLKIRVWHPVAAVLVGGYLVATVLFLPSLQSAQTRLPGRFLVATVGIQIALGCLNLVLLAPIAMQLVHLLAADAVWIALVVFAAAAWERT